MFPITLRPAERVLLYCLLIRTLHLKHFIKVASWLSLLTLQRYKRKSKIKGVFSLSYWKKNEIWSNLIKNLFARFRNIQYWYNFGKNYWHCLVNDVTWHEPLFLWPKIISFLYYNTRFSKCMSYQSKVVTRIVSGGITGRWHITK